MSRHFTVQAGYSTHYANTVTVEADTLEEALGKALEGADCDPWGEGALPVPDRFTERGAGAVGAASTCGKIGDHVGVPILSTSTVPLGGAVRHGAPCRGADPWPRREARGSSGFALRQHRRGPGGGAGEHLAMAVLIAPAGQPASVQLGKVGERDLAGVDAPP